MTKIKISIIVPCYNQSLFLPQALESVLNQTLVEWECIIINDGSVDNSEEIANQWCKKDNRFLYIYQENGGVISARNNAISKSKGEYILPLDADDYIHNNYLREAVEYFTEKPATSIVYSNTQTFGAYEEIWNDKFDLSIFLFRNLIPNSSVFKKSDWLKVNGYNPNMKNGFEDWEFWVSLVELGGKIHKIEKVYYFYRQVEESRSRKIDTSKYNNLLKQIALNHLQFYAENLGDPLTLSLKIKDLDRQKKLLKNSIAYKIGNFIISPFKLIKNLIKK